MRELGKDGLMLSCGVVGCRVNVSNYVVNNNNKKKQEIRTLHILHYLLAKVANLHEEDG